MNIHETVKKYKLTPNQLYLLWCIGTKKQPSTIDTNTEFRKLKALGIVDDKLTISDQGLIILDSLSEKTDKSENVTIFSDNVKQYIKLFPPGKLPSGKPSRINEKTITTCFKWFFANYNYSWDTIFKATKHYVSTFEDTDYKYMRNSQYFIVKSINNSMKDSELADYCDMILSKSLQENDNQGFKDNVV
jgi:hypothetical protein